MVGRREQRAARLVKSRDGVDDRCRTCQPDGKHSTNIGIRRYNEHTHRVVDWKAQIGCQMRATSQYFCESAVARNLLDGTADEPDSNGFPKGITMLSTRWRPQPTAGNDVAATWPLMLPEWEVIVAGRAHMLLEGEKSRVRQTIFALASQVPRTVTCWHAGAIWPVTPHTFIVENVETLSPAEQREL